MTALEVYLGGGDWGESCPRCSWHLSERGGRTVCEVCGYRVRRQKPGVRKAHRRLCPRDVLLAQRAIKVTRDLRRAGHKAEMRATLAKWRKGRSEATPQWFRALYKDWGCVPRWAGYITRGYC